jgi:hypothetical protein
MTHLELFTNADDLELQVVNAKGKYAIVFSRGPRHRFKLLFTTEPIFNNKDEAVGRAMEALRIICVRAAAELVNSTSVIAAYANPHLRPVSEMSNVVTDELLQRIEQELKEKGVASTYKMLAA